MRLCDSINADRSLEATAALLHVCLKFIFVDAKEGGAESAALVQAQGGLDAGRDAGTRCFAHCHGGVGIYYIYNLVGCVPRNHSPPKLRASSLTHRSLRCTSGLVAGLFGISKTGLQLRAALALLILERSKHEGRLPCAAPIDETNCLLVIGAELWAPT